MTARHAAAEPAPRALIVRTTPIHSSRHLRRPRHPRRARAERLPRRGDPWFVLAVAGLLSALPALAAFAGEREAAARASEVLVFDASGEEGGAWRVPEEGPGPRVVLLIHGLDEPGDIWDDLAPALHEAGHAVARFEYPNDQRIGSSADLLAGELEGLRGRGVGRADLVCHSMGGLVALDALTRHDGSRFPRVETLIAVGTPFGGSPWARLRIVAEAREQMLRACEGRLRDEAGRWSFRADGDGGAGRDLAADSEFIRRLAGRPLPAGLRLVCVVAELNPERGGWIEPEEAASSRLVRALAGARGAARLAEWIEEGSEFLGDGVVPVASAVHPEADEVVFVEANHRTILERLGPEVALRKLWGMPERAQPPGIPVILAALGESDP